MSIKAIINDPKVFGPFIDKGKYTEQDKKDIKTHLNELRDQDPEDRREEVFFISKLRDNMKHFGMIIDMFVIIGLPNRIDDILASPKERKVQRINRKLKNI